MEWMWFFPYFQNNYYNVNTHQQLVASPTQYVLYRGYNMPINIWNVSFKFTVNKTFEIGK